MYKANYTITTGFFQNVFITNQNSKHLPSQSYFHVASNPIHPSSLPPKKKFL